MFRSKNFSVKLEDPQGAAQFPKEFLNPSEMVTRLQKAAAEGKVKIVEAQYTDEFKKWQGMSDWAPKVLVVNPPDPQGQVEVYLIDPRTKLLQQFEKYRKNGTELVFLARFRFDDYNLPIPADVFTPRLPADALKLDETAPKEIGLAQGQMTDAEVATAVVKQFWEAMIAQDFDKASILYGGFPAERLKKSLSEPPVVEIVSIGEPTADPYGRKDVRSVPYSVKFKGGEVKQGNAYVRQVYGQPHRWDLDGGI